MTLTESTTTYEATTALGVPIKTFATRDLAVRWWSAFADEFPGCRVDEVETVTTVVRRAVRKAKMETTR